MKIAIVKLSSLGDIVHAMVALQFIKARLPDVEIDWVVEKRFAEVLNHQPDITNLVTVDLQALKADKTKVFGEIRRLRKYASRHYDLVIDAQGLLKSSLTARLLGKRVSGFDADSAREKAASWFYHIKVAYPYHANTIDRNATVLTEPLGIRISREDILAKKPFLFFHDADPRIPFYCSKNRKNIIFVIGSTWESRVYPHDKLVKIAQALQQNCLVIWGNEKERRQAEWLCEQSDLIQIVPKLDLNNLKALMARADLVIGNDTGPTHMAWGLNRPSITIFGPTPVNRVYETDINKTVKSASEVNPYKLDKNDFSIRSLNEGLIINLAESLLSQAADPDWVKPSVQSQPASRTHSANSHTLDELEQSLVDVDWEEFFLR